MSVKKEIFEKFLSQLSENEEFPKKILASIKQHLDSNNTITKDELLVAINEGLTDGSEN
jgi:hypothetical protein